MTNIHQQIEQERDAAREACSVNATSSECAAAWDVVEELQAEVSHQRENKSEKSALEKFCDDNPDADECRLYED